MTESEIKLLDALESAGAKWAVNLRPGRVFTGCLSAARQFLNERLGPKSGEQAALRERLASVFVRSALRALAARKVYALVDAETGTICRLQPVRRADALPTDFL